MYCIFDIVEHPTHCDGCGAKFSIAQGLECKKGGLVIQRNDEIKIELQDLAARALIPSVVHDEPQIYPGRSADVEETKGMSTPTEEHAPAVLFTSLFLWNLSPRKS